MRCINPLPASFDNDGAITHSSKKAVAGLVGFEFPCRKCLPCRLNIGREKAIRAYHEAQMHPGSIFLTLTYDEESLPSERLVYADWQNFLKRLRYTLAGQKISTMVTGEYGSINKRPHWHALIFNYWPHDYKKVRENDLGNNVYTSEEIAGLWKKGRHDFGEVSLESAGYVARYAAKKLVHGKDEDHDYQPIHKTSSKNAIGRSWIERYYKHTFENGFVVLPNGHTAKIPRYYVDWCKKNKPTLWEHYVTQVLPDVIAKVELKERKEEMEYFSQLWSRKWSKPNPLPRAKVKETYLKQKFKQLQEHLKL